MPNENAIRDMIVQAAGYAVLLPMALAAVVFLIALFVPRGAYFGAVLAIVVGFAAANHFRDSLDFRVLPIADANPDEPTPADPNLDPTQVAWAAATGLGGPSIGEATVKISRQWLPWCIVFAGLLGAIGRLPWMPTSLLRVAAALAAAILLVTPAMREEASWLAPVFVLVILAEWELCESVARSSGPGVWPLSAAILFGAAATVTIHAHGGKYADAALILSACCLGVAIVAWARRGDASGISPVVAVALPGMMLVVRDQTFSEVPLTGFLAIALSPLGLVPAALMAKCDCGPKWARSLAVVLGPAAIATIGIVLAVMYESLLTG
jgi:hypothetical protein